MASARRRLYLIVNKYRYGAIILLQRRALANAHGTITVGVCAQWHPRTAYVWVVSFWPTLTRSAVSYVVDCSVSLGRIILARACMSGSVVSRRG